MLQLFFYDNDLVKDVGCAKFEYVIIFIAVFINMPVKQNTSIYYHCCRLLL